MSRCKFRVWNWWPALLLRFCQSSFFFSQAKCLSFFCGEGTGLLCGFWLDAVNLISVNFFCHTHTHIFASLHARCLFIRPSSHGIIYTQAVPFNCLNWAERKAVRNSRPVRFGFQSIYIRYWEALAHVHVIGLRVFPEWRPSRSVAEKQ